jgi:uncharacterized BrkB/YihY/UPF0761 family membrane protein
LGRVDAPDPDRTPDESLSALLAELAARPTEDTGVARLRARGLVVAREVTSWGPLAPVAEVGWRTLRRDSSIGGSVLSGALAYRLFIWLLPFALVLVIGFGWATDLKTGSRAIRHSGLTGFMAHSVADSTQKTRGFGALVAFVTAVLVLLYQTSVLLRAVRAVTALAWGLPVTTLRRPVRSQFLFLGWMLVLIVVAASAAPLRTALDYPWSLVSALAVYTALPALYLVLACWLLPRPPVHWLRLVPGAILFGTAFTLIGLFNSLILFPWLEQRQATYGVLGLAAGLLFGLFLVGRAFELAAALNATLAEKQPP